MVIDYKFVKYGIAVANCDNQGKNALAYLRERNLSPSLENGYNNYATEYKELQNCIIFPLKDRSGNIVSLYGRSITDI